MFQLQVNGSDWIQTGELSPAALGCWDPLGSRWIRGFSRITNPFHCLKSPRKNFPAWKKNQTRLFRFSSKASGFQPHAVLHPFPRKWSGEFPGTVATGYAWRQSGCSDTLHTQPDSHQSQQDPLLRPGGGSDEPTDRARLPWTQSRDRDASGVPQPSYLRTKLGTSTIPSGSTREKSLFAA